MITESPQKMLSEMGVRSVTGSGGDGFGGEDLGNDLGLLLRQQRRQGAIDHERELNLYRSGSAPPTVEGSLNAVGGLFGDPSAAAAAAAAAGLSDLSGGRNENGFLNEEELLADPAYHAYYYSHVNLNPRLPPPVLSKEDWRFTQRLHAGSSGLGGIGDRRELNRGMGSGAMEEGGRSLFSLQPGFSSQTPGSRDWLETGEDGLIGLSGLSLGRQKSFADIFQDDLCRTTPISGHPSRPPSRNTFDDGVEPLGSAENHLALHHEFASIDGLQPGGNIQSVSGLQNIGVSTSHTFASVLASSLSRSTTPDPQLVARAPSPSLPPVGVRLDGTDMRNNNGSSSFKGVPYSKVESDDLLAALSGMSLSNAGAMDEENITQLKFQQEIDDHQKYFFDMQGGQNYSKQHPFLKKSGSGHFGMSSIPQPDKSSYPDSARRAGSFVDARNSASRLDGQAELHMHTVPSASSYLKGPSSPSITSPGSSAHYQNVDGANGSFSSYGLGGYSPALPSMMAANLPPLFENAANASAIASLGIDTRTFGGSLSSVSNLTGTTDLQNLNRIGNLKAAAALQTPLADPLYIQYLKAAGYPAQVAANFADPSGERGYMGNSYMDLLGIQKAYGALLQPQEQYGMPFHGKYGASHHAYYGNPAYGLGVTNPGRSSLANPILPTSPVGPGTPLRHGERNMRFPSGSRNSTGGIMGSWHLDHSGSMDENFPSSLLEEFKSNKTRCFELSEIAGHVVEFSADQYGSRFIQQKLETATAEEKNMVFEEIMPQALSLMTDVFGNYVVQKFFEHGSAAQIRELANQLNGHVLALSLQMYGCRVIQKAIEVVDLDQQIRMVAELDGHVMRCVRDQNGNHVIQKCIECIPQDAIEFIISTFYDQVVTLSTHPYGCRVIQRVLEHCDDPKTQQIVMDEIMQCVCMLAQDQYGNYVVQHVLEHGKSHERSAIIKQLAGQIVKMSQQKFASNVVEKCLTFGGPVERQILVNEMLGSTDENEPLQAMMKDQFANYVVQKVLETCDDQHRELILSRIKVHLNALKKYTYGKHIVARVEKLVAAGERRIGLQSHYPS